MLTLSRGKVKMNFIPSYFRESGKNRANKASFRDAGCQYMPIYNLKWEMDNAGYSHVLLRKQRCKLFRLRFYMR